jgi:hypothetical protein
MRNRVSTIAAVIGSLGLAPETASRVTWLRVKMGSLENTASGEVVCEVAKRVLWCAVPSLVGGAVAALSTAIVVTGVFGGAYRRRHLPLPHATHLAMFTMSVILAIAMVLAASTALATAK